MSAWGIETPCGTVACAAGRCGLDAWFNEQGWKLKPEPLEDVLNRRNACYLMQQTIEQLDPLSWQMKGSGGFEGDVKVSAFFGSPGSGAVFLDPTLRPVESVIKEVQHYISFLKAIPRLQKAYKPLGDPRSIDEIRYNRTTEYEE